MVRKEASPRQEGSQKRDDAPTSGVPSKPCAVAGANRILTGHDLAREQPGEPGSHGERRRVIKQKRRLRCSALREAVGLSDEPSKACVGR